jgi:hypothetical protein
MELDSHIAFPEVSMEDLPYPPLKNGKALRMQGFPVAGL